MKTPIVWPLLGFLFACGAVQADRIAGTPPPKASQAYKTSPAKNILSGSVTDIDASGSQVQIDGRWYVIKQGRTQLLRNGLPLNTGVLSKGQKVRFSMASQTAGELALGVIYVP
ncbi:MAG: hypothetical protein OEM00_08645 [Burkholderiaceae bacterium]|nr:hypothetical protein [Burkholderiaceae bacterium]MDH3461031.1 hypothetical protein [Burkholderiaceae bacterium]